MSNILGYTANRVGSIAANLDGAEPAIQMAQNVKNFLAAKAKAIAAREFMYELRGDNQQIRNENLLGLRDKGALELSKAA